jgi:hypothetical protein
MHPITKRGHNAFLNQLAMKRDIAPPALAVRSARGTPPVEALEVVVNQTVSNRL